MDHIKNRSGKDPELFVFADYMKPRKRIEKLSWTNKNGETFQEYFVCEMRKEELPKWKLDKHLKQKLVEPFDKEKSMFKPWL